MLSVVLIGLSITNNAYSQYCTASTTTIDDEFIGNVSFNTINNSSGGNGYSDYTNISTTLSKGKSYTITVLSGGNFYSNDKVSCWIDYNQNYTFDATEKTDLTSDDGGETFTASVSVPLSANSGSTRMRVRMVWNSDPSPCGSSSYGEVEDYTVNLQPPPPDAAITSLTSPTSPFSVGIYPVKAMLESKADVTLTYATITWGVNGVTQGSVPWSGSLKKGDKVEVFLGNFSFTYPQGSSFNPFNVKVEVSNANGFAQDFDPSNDVLNTMVAPTLNDCGAIGFFGPSAGFGPGVTQVRARVRNYAPKPLSSVTINWKIDGVAQAPATIGGLNIPEGQYADVVVGTYTFYNKTPLGPFSVEVETSNPNGVKDEDPTNDKYTGGIGPSLVAGTYTIGGYSPHFNDVTTAMSYLNSSGVFGQGTIVFEVRSGMYNGQVVLNNPPANGNPIEIRSSTGNPYDAVIYATPSNKDNYVFMLDGVKNVTFKNISLQNNNPNYSLAGTVLKVNNASVTLDRAVLSGVKNAPKDVSYNNLYLMNSSAMVNRSIFTGGSSSLYVDNSFSNSNFKVENTSFTDFTGSGIYYMGQNQAHIMNNSFKWETGLTPNNAVTIIGSAHITSNTFAGMVGTGDANEGIIKINGNSNYSDIVGNNISGTNINGIRLDNAMVMINRNYISLSQAAQNLNSLIFSNMSSGWIGNNMMLASGLYGIHIHNSNNLNVIYNTISLTGNRPVFHTIGGNYQVARNVIMNHGSSYNFEMNGGTSNIRQNLNYNAAGMMAMMNGNMYPTIGDMQAANYDAGSVEGMITTENATNLHVKYYTPEMLFGGALFADNSMGNIIEESDYDGEMRTSFYAGSDEIFLAITLNRQSEGFIDCENADDNSLTVSAEINYGASVTYQWYKDGIQIPGEVEPVLYFPSLKFSQSGVYYCRILGPGTTAPVNSKAVAVYVSTPTEVTQQPQDEKVTLGHVATFNFEAHVNGKMIEEAIENYEVKVQWYKVVNETTANPVVDNLKNSGSKSNYFTIKNVAKSDFGKYYAVIEGICATIQTNVVELSEEILEVTIVESPAPVTQCQNTDITFNADASTQSSLAIEYQWYKDGAKLNNINMKIDGVNSKHLTIYDMTETDEGEYWAVANLKGTTVKATTAKAKLTVTPSPVITVQPEDVTVAVDDQLSLSVEVENMEEVGLAFQWYKDGAKINGANEFIYLVEDAKVENSGEYWCEITNSCGTTTSTKVVVTVTNTGTTDVAEVAKAGYRLSTAIPNPVNTVSNFTYNLSNAGNVVITLNDANGQLVSELVNQFQGIGNYTAQISADNLLSGVYFIKLEVNGYVLVNKVVVNK